MKVIRLLFAISLLFWAASAQGAESARPGVTETMEEDFLSRLKSAIAHHDVEAFRALFYESENGGAWRQLQATPPYSTLFSNAPRTYAFAPPLTRRDGTQLLRQTVTPVFFEPGWFERLQAAAELVATFPTLGPFPDGSHNIDVPLAVRHRKLWAVRGGFIVN